MEEEKKKRIAAIGTEEFILGFELAGVKRTYNDENYREKINELLGNDDIGIVVAEQSDIDELPEKTRKKVETSVDPVIVTLSEDTGISGLQEKIKNVIGIDIS